MYKIYIHLNKIHGKVYIGQTKNDCEERWRNGEGYKYNTHFYGAIKKYGWNNFDHKVLDCLTLDEANAIEKFLISYYDATNPENGYNIALGGMNAPKSEECKKKLSEANKGKHRSKESIEKQRLHISGENNGMYGKKHTKEAREKISKAHRGIKHTIEERANISKRTKGENNPMFGKHFSEDSKEKMRKAIKGRHWYNNGIEQTQAFVCPDGWVKGMLRK